MSSNHPDAMLLKLRHSLPHSNSFSINFEGLALDQQVNVGLGQHLLGLYQRADLLNGIGSLRRLHLDFSFSSGFRVPAGKRKSDLSDLRPQGKPVKGISPANGYRTVLEASDAKESTSPGLGDISERVDLAVSIGGRQ